MRGLGLKNSLVRHLSSLITASRITVMKHVLRLHLKAMRYSLPLFYGNHRKKFPKEVDHLFHLPALRRHDRRIRITEAPWPVLRLQARLLRRSR